MGSIVGYFSGPAASDYTKSGGYVGKLQHAEIEAMQTLGDFGGMGRLGRWGNPKIKD